MNYFKLFKIFFFKFFYEKVTKTVSNKESKYINIKKVSFNKKYFYNIYILKNATNYLGSVHDTALIINNKVFPQASYQFRYNKRKLIHNGDVNKNVIFTEGITRFRKKISGGIISLLTGGGGKENYFHWLFDVLPRIAILEKSNFNFKKLKFLLPSKRLNFQKETLKLLKISSNMCLDSNYFKHISAKEIILTDHPYVFKNNPTNSILNIPIWIIAWLRKKFKNKKIKNNLKYSKIYIDRSDSKFSKNRYIINEEEIKKYLLKNSFKSIILSKINFKKQVSIFSSAKIIVGAHGAGFSNIIFSKPGTKIIELQSRTSGNVIKNLSKKCKLRYSKIVSSTHKIKSNDPHGKILINLNTLKKKIN